MENEKHPALELSSEERVSYLKIVVSLAAADGDVSDSEIAHIRSTCKDLGLSAADIGAVVAAAEEPDAVGIRESILALADSDLRFTLVSDLLFVAYADGRFSADERKEVNDIADALGITQDQLAALQKYVDAVRKAADAKSVNAGDLKDLGAEVTAGLVATGVPVAAVAISGTVGGLSAAGITSGLAALGMGLGMTTGIGVVVGIGIASYLGVRWLAKKALGRAENGGS